MGRKCAVPHCYTGYRKCTDKASLYKVPDDDFFLSKWQEAIAREDRPITPKDYVCEKHFKDDDILRKRIRKDIVEVYQRPRLKPDAIPSIFPDLPEFILKMTKKRRRLDAPLPNNNIIDISVESDEEKVDEECTVKDEPQDSSPKTTPEINDDEINIKTEIEDTSGADGDEDKEEYDSTGAKLYRCDECSYKTKFAHNLRTHKVKHLSGEDAYMTCEICTDYKTKWEITYLNHMKSKHGQILKEYFKCPLCPFKTKNKNFLAKHCNTEHENREPVKNVENKFKCDFTDCTYETDSQALLYVHSLTHNKPTLEQNAMVQEANESSDSPIKIKNKRNLTKHLAKEHERKKNRKVKQKFMCELKCCGFKTESKALLNIHNLNHNKPRSEETSTVRMLSCKECYFKSNSKAALIKHVKSAHSAGDDEDIASFINKTNNINRARKVAKPKNIDINNKKQKNNSKITLKGTKSTVIATKKGLKKQTSLFKCSRCPYKSRSEALLQKHVSKHQTSPNGIQNVPHILLCPKCDFQTLVQADYINHQTYTFHCNECPYISTDKADYLKHTLTHRNTSIEKILRNPEESNSNHSNGLQEQMEFGQDFCLVTIKEEERDLFMEDS